MTPTNKLRFVEREIETGRHGNYVVAQGEEEMNNRDDIFDMAREAGFANVRGGLMDNGELSDYWDCWPGQLERFFHLAYAAGADAEREACAQLCADYTAWGREWGQDNNHMAAEAATNECAAAIRARREKT